MQGCINSNGFRFSLIAGLAAVTLLQACETAPEPVAPAPDYGRALGPGESALRKLGPDEEWPDLTDAWRQRDAFLSQAIAQDITWFQAPSSKNRFPSFDVCNWDVASSSVVAFQQVLADSKDVASFTGAMKQMFDCWQTKGWNGNGTVLFTGYYAPEFKASLTKTAEFQYPIYKRPADLATDPNTGEPMGRRMPDGSLSKWPSRAEIEKSGMLAGTELAWFKTPLDAYIVQVNGSAKLSLPDGKTAFIGYAGATDGEYVGLGDSLVKEGIIKEEELTLSAVRKMGESDPAKIQDLINRNNRFIFFSSYDGNNWPAGCLGVRVTEKSSLATDKSIYPAGGLVMVDTQTAGFDGKKRPFRRFMLDQDAGGAIRAPGRADIFMGIGPSAEILAGGQYFEGTMFYFYLKPEYASQYPLPEKPKAAGSKAPAKTAASVKAVPGTTREAAQSSGSPETVRMGGLGAAKADTSNPTG